ncbi:MAG: FKBP-type peptidyl-prolyl cis-trans isomerase [Cytophagales bacterium]|nr:FKBP-type peptidyl-prolyl cis-trans isomerase [Cytophagales bacterium]MDW8383543.1 FKBP-type peptidyl-prolyl cis-trans isomerase [Flammeovirgaceae bacterium]
MYLKVSSICCIAVFLAFCQKKSETSKGVKYSFHIDTSSVQAQPYDFITFHLNVFNHQDSLLVSSYQLGKPFTYQVSSDPTIKIIDEVLLLCSEGDSVSFEVPVDSLPKGFFHPAASGSFVRWELKVLKVQSEEEFFKEVQERESKKREEMIAKMKEHKKIDDNLIQEYLKKHRLKAQKTESGLYYVIIKPGQGKSPSAGQKVKVHYTGTLLNGEKFDSSLDRETPFEFVLGEGAVIKGWNEGIALLNKGAKATLLIPSALAYGPNEVGIIPAYSVLKFDVELIDF